MSTIPALHAAHRARAWAWWLIPAIALGALIAWETDWGRHVLWVPAAPAPVTPKPVQTSVLPEYQLEGGIAARSETVSRTLFNATRRPAPVLAAEGGGPRRIQPGQFQLVGTTVTGDRNVAFLKEVNGGKARTVRQGDEINGMQVALVAPDRVRLTAGDDSEELVLKVARGPKTTLAAAPPLPAAVNTGQAAPTAAAAAQAAQAAQQRAQAPGASGAPSPAAVRRANRRAAADTGAAQGSAATGSTAQPAANPQAPSNWDSVYQNMQQQQQQPRRQQGK